LWNKNGKGEYIAFLDDDDIWPRNYLKLRKNLITKHNCFFSASPYDYIDEKLKLIREIRYKKMILNKKDFISKNPIANSTVIIKKSLLIQAGGYSHLKKRNDFATWLRTIEIDNCYYFNNLTHVRVLRRKGSLSAKKFGLFKYQFKAFKEGKISTIISLIYSLNFALRSFLIYIQNYLYLSSKRLKTITLFCFKILIKFNK